jgi:hypothetical protein
MTIGFLKRNKAPSLEAKRPANSAADGFGGLPEGGWIGKSDMVTGLRDRMSLQLKQDPKNPKGYYATLAEYDRLPIPSPEKVQVTKWVPRMHVYYVQYVGGQSYSMTPMHLKDDKLVMKDGETPAVLNMKKPGEMKGAVLQRFNADNSVAETINFKGKSCSTWEGFVPGKFFKSVNSSGFDYFTKKKVNTFLSEDHVATFNTDALKGDYDMIEVEPGVGLYRFQAKNPGQLGAEELEQQVGQFIDIMNWKPKFRTNELMTIDPNNPRNDGFYYERPAKKTDPK